MLESIDAAILEGLRLTVANARTAISVTRNVSPDYEWGICFSVMGICRALELDFQTTLQVFEYCNLGEDQCDSSWAVWNSMPLYQHIADHAKPDTTEIAHVR